MPRTSTGRGRGRNESPLKLQLLGRPRIWVGSEIELPTRKALALLAYLALGGPTTRQHAATLLWSGHGDEDGRRNLRQELHRLKSTDVGRWIESRDDELALRPGADIDVANLRRAAAAAADAQILALYGGPLLADLELRGADEFADWLNAERESLAELWRAALTREVAARERDGNLAGAAELARTLVDSDPLDESRHRDLMRLLYLAGDRGSALLQFERCREILRREFGASPTEDTLAWARRMQGPVEVSAPAADAPTDLEPPLIGREDAWTRLAAARGSLALVTGEPGLGKSRLLGEFARAHGRVVVLEGREISRNTPFFPVAEALWQAYRDDTRWFELLDPVWRAEVARLIPALAGDEANAELPATEARGRFLEGLTAALLTAAGEGTLLFDDLHWFDGASAELVAHVVRRAQRVRLLAAARQQDLAGNPAVESALAAIAHDGLLVRIALEPLTESDVLKLVRALSGSTGATVFARRLHGATAGNPLFIMESLRDLFSAGVLWREKGTWSTPYDEDTEDYRELPISRSVREAVLRRIDRLGEGTRRALEVASLAGDRFEVELIGACTTMDEWSLVDALDRATLAQIVTPGASGYRFTHELVRRSLDNAMTAERRRLVHRRLADALARTDAAPAEVAQHLEAGGRAREAIGARVRAAEAAARIHASRESITHYEAALADGADGVDAFRIHSACVEVSRNLGDESVRARSLAAMTAIAARLDDPTLNAEVAIKRTVQAFEHDRYAEGLAIACAARDDLRGRIDEQTDAALLLEIGATHVALRHHAQAQECLRVAIERFRGTSPLKVANCAYWLCRCAIDEDDLDAAQEHASEALRMTELAGYRRGHALTLFTLAELAWRRSDSERALGLLEDAVREAREIGSVQLLRGFLGELVTRCRERGDDARASRWQQELDALTS